MPPHAERARRPGGPRPETIGLVLLCYDRGLSRDRVARRALLSHTFTYSLAFVPAFVWIASRLGWQTLLVAAAVSIPHLVQDDGRLLTLYLRKVKGMDPAAHRPVAALVDQAVHMVALFGAALLVSALK
jgi:hypothetical protein